MACEALPGCRCLPGGSYVYLCLFITTCLSQRHLRSTPIYFVL